MMQQKTIWILAGITLLGVLVITYLAYLVIHFPDTHPDQTLTIEQRINNFFERITLPIKLAKLSAQEPDAHILIPVYGMRKSGVADTFGAPRGEDRIHEGQDMFARIGTPIFSATYGYITRINVDSELGGNNIFIVGAGGRRYYYAHLDRFAEGLRIGQEVTIDTVIGFVGNSGNAETTPPHLHFGLYENREAINPYPLLADRTWLK